MESLARKIASIHVDLSEIRYNMIFGTSPTDFLPAPPLENSSIFKGRYGFHRPQFYPVGPYRMVKEFI